MERMSGKRWLLLYLIFVSAVPPMTTDMYLPALPSIGEHFNSNVGTVNLTLVLFFVFFSASLLIWGTMSDKYGRRKILIICNLVYTVSSFLCAISDSIAQLIVFRVFQAMGGGATISVSMAVMKDVFEGKERARLLAICQTLAFMAPITAPIVGALILHVLSWRGIFLILGCAGLVAFTGAVIMNETAEKRADMSVLQTISNLYRALGNPGFAYPLPLFSAMSIPFFLFLGASSDIFISFFGLSPQIYSFFFAFNAIFSAIGTCSYILLSRYMGISSIIRATFVLTLMSGISILVIGSSGPLVFAITLLPATIGTSLLRPPSVNLLLDQVDKDAGAASSVMTFSFVFSGSLGMQFISLAWSDRIFMIGIVDILVGLCCFILWPVVYRKCVKK